MFSSKKEHKRFLEQELSRYEDLMSDLEPDSEDYPKIKKLYLETYKELYPIKNLWDKTIDILKIVVPAGVSVGLGVYAYHKNENLESKDGDVWREARSRH